jgi:serine/threonine-protein kinase RsbW
MSSESLKMHISIPPVEGIEDVPVAAVEALASKMGFTPDRVQDIIQALTEACVNAILYSSSDKDIEVVVIAMQNSLILEVQDRGSGFDPACIGTPDFELISEIGVKSGGFGIHMIKSLVDEVEIESSDQGTTVRMSTFLSSPNSSSLTP